MCISINQEQIALFEIFRKTDRKNFVPDSPTFPVDNDEIPNPSYSSLKILKPT